MAYVKISDPKIIDLSTIHQIVNVVNQHSDNITALTNNFGSTAYGGSSGVTSGGTLQYLHDISSQQIIYGKTTFNVTNRSTYTESVGGKSYRWYTIPVSFIGQPFSSAPIVTAQLNYDSTQSNVAFEGLFLKIGNTSTSQFTIYARSLTAAATDTDWLTGSLFFNVNWTAIGPK